MSQTASLQTELDQSLDYKNKELPVPGENEVFKDTRNGKLLMRIGGISDHNTFIEVVYDEQTGWKYAHNATPIKIGFGDKQAFEEYSPNNQHSF
jgi:hypothetical protein